MLVIVCVCAIGWLCSAEHMPNRDASGAVDEDVSHTLLGARRKHQLVE